MTEQRQLYPAQGWRHTFVVIVLFCLCQLLCNCRALLPLPGSTWSQTKISRIDPMLVLFLKYSLSLLKMAEIEYLLQT